MVVHGMPRSFRVRDSDVFEDPNRTHCSLVMLVAGASVLGKYATQRRIPALVLLHRLTPTGAWPAAGRGSCSHSSFVHLRTINWFESLQLRCPLPPLVPSRMDSQAWLVSLVAGVGLLRYARGAAAAAPASTSAPIVVVGTKNKCKLAAVRASLARYEQSEEKR